MGLSSLLTEAMIPLCAWGMVSSLVLFLIELRSVFVAGGETWLRCAVLAFSAAVVLLQRMLVKQGKSVATGYAIVVLLAIVGFAIYHTSAHPTAFHPLVMFLIDLALLLVLWWVAHRITAACSADSDAALDAAGESGALSGIGRAMRREKKQSEEDAEKLWRQRLPKRHSGRVVFLFSLVALPLFTFGTFMFEPDDFAPRMLAGALMFIYLWCGFTLLVFASLGQVRRYFSRRKVMLPEHVGLPWIAIGVLVVSIVVVAALFLPQPPSVAGAFVRERVVSTYSSLETRWGVKDVAQSGRRVAVEGEGRAGGSGGEKRTPSERVEDFYSKRYGTIDKMGDEYLSETARVSGWESDLRNVVTLQAATKESFSDLFRLVLRILAVIVIAFLVLAVAALVIGTARGVALGWGQVRLTRRPRKRKRRKRREDETYERPAVTLRRYPNPFLVPPGESGSDALVRYTWHAFLAACAEGGSPCPPHRTPKEFVRADPAPLEGFEQQAQWIADLYTFSEFSNQPVDEGVRPQLRMFWEDLERHAIAQSA